MSGRAPFGLARLEGRAFRPGSTAERREWGDWDALAGWTGWVSGLGSLIGGARLRGIVSVRFSGGGERAVGGGWVYELVPGERGAQAAAGSALILASALM